MNAQKSYRKELLEVEDDGTMYRKFEISAADKEQLGNAEEFLLNNGYDFFIARQDDGSALLFASNGKKVMDILTEHDVGFIKGEKVPMSDVELAVKMAEPVEYSIDFASLTKNIFQHFVDGAVKKDPAMANRYVILPIYEDNERSASLQLEVTVKAVASGEWAIDVDLDIHEPAFDDMRPIYGIYAEDAGSIKYSDFVNSVKDALRDEVSGWAGRDTVGELKLNKNKEKDNRSIYKM